MAYIIKNFIDTDLALKIKDISLSNPFAYSDHHPDYSDKLQWENSPVLEEAMELLYPSLDTHLPEYDIDKHPNFQRVYIPFGIHHDSKKRHNLNRPDEDCTPDSVAILIPMDEGPYFNTVFWKEKHFDTQSMLDEFNEFGMLEQSELKNTGIGDEYDLAFSWEDTRPGYQLYNHLTLDCVFNWKIGDAAVFDRTQLHAATDFTKHCPFKDAITIFFNH